MMLKVLVHEEVEGGYWAEVLSLPGCVSQGDTWEEVLANIKEAAEGWLLAAADQHLPEPSSPMPPW